MITNPVDQEKIRKALQEICDSKTRVAAERELMKEIVTNLHEQFKEHLSKRQINKMAKTYYLRSFKEEIAAHEEFEVLYESIIGE